MRRLSCKKCFSVRVGVKAAKYSKLGVRVGDAFRYYSYYRAPLHAVVHRWIIVVFRCMLVILVSSRMG